MVAARLPQAAIPGPPIQRRSKGVSVVAVLSQLLLPPPGLALLALLLLVLRQRLLAGVALAGLLLLSLGPVGTALLAALDVPVGDVAGPAPGAIVVLGGDVQRTAGYQGGVPNATVGALSLQRVQAGAALQRRTGLPMLMTGGIVETGVAPVGELMARSARDDFAARVRWVEPLSRDTWENAAFSAPLLKAAGISRVFVVTHDWHMRRALVAFRHAGIDAVPSPTYADPRPRLAWTDLLPSAGNWMRSYFAVHEWVGLAYYALRR